MDSFYQSPIAKRENNEKSENCFIITIAVNVLLLLTKKNVHLKMAK